MNPAAAEGVAVREFKLHKRAADLVAGGGDVVWNEIVRGFADPLSGSRIAPDAAPHAIYRQMLDVYAACEAFARGAGADPAPSLKAFRSRLGGTL